MASIDPTVLYTLTNAFTGSSRVLALSTGSSNLFISTYSSSATQLWHFTLTTSTGFYRLHISQLGDTKSLDVYNDNDVNSKLVYLTDTGDYSGQFWRLDPWGDGTFKLSNNFTGVDKHLDVYSDTLEANLATGGTTGQHWTLNKVSAMVSSAAVSISAPTQPVIPPPTSPSTSLSLTTTLTSPSTLSSTAAVSSTTITSNASGLATGSVVGIAVGGFFGLALLISAIWFLASRKKSRPSLGGSATEASTQVDPAPIPELKGDFKVQEYASELEGGQFEHSQLESGRVQDPAELSTRQY